MVRVQAFFLILFLLLGFQAEGRKVIQFFSLKPGFISAKTYGSIYRDSELNLPLLSAEYNVSISPNWRLTGLIGGDLEGQYARFSMGATFHFKPIAWDTQIVDENIDIISFPKYNPFVGFHLGFSRVQIVLEQETTGNKDAIIGGVLGPTLATGIYFSHNKEFFYSAEFNLIYEYSPQVASMGTGFFISLSYILP